MSLFSHLPFDEFTTTLDAEVDTRWRSGGGDDGLPLMEIEVRRLTNGGREEEGLDFVDLEDLVESLEALRLKTPMTMRCGR